MQKNSYNINYSTIYLINNLLSMRNTLKTLASAAALSLAAQQADAQAGNLVAMMTQVAPNTAGFNVHYDGNTPINVTASNTLTKKAGTNSTYYGVDTRV
jgi:hypothetical protein